MWCFDESNYCLGPGEGIGVRDWMKGAEAPGVASGETDEVGVRRIQLPTPIPTDLEEPELHSQHSDATSPDGVQTLLPVEDNDMEGYLRYSTHKEYHSQTPFRNQPLLLAGVHNAPNTPQNG